MAGNMAQRVLTAQTEIRRTGPTGTRHHLITPEELSEIRRIWRGKTRI